MGYYGNYYGNSLFHSEKRDLNGTSISKEKGTDNKYNNTSEYNHDYYMRNKDKWGVKTAYYTKEDSDFDNANYDEKNRIGNSDFFVAQDKDGNYYILEEDMKWKIPNGAKPSQEMLNQLANFKGIDGVTIKNGDDWEKEVERIINSDGGSGGKEFDIDAAAMDVIRGKYKNGQERKDALGDDYTMVQARVNEILKGKKSASTGDSSKSDDTSSSSTSNSQNGSKLKVAKNWTEVGATKVANAQLIADEKKAKKEAEEQAKREAAEEAARKEAEKEAKKKKK